MKTTKKVLSLALALVMMFSTLAIFGTVEASALSGVGTNTEFRLEKANHTFGCDISTYNVLGASVLDYSRVDFAKMKADGCDFAILRLGLNHSSNHACQIDKAFLEYYNRARAAGMKLGVYFYSRARTAAEATTEANFVIKTIEDNNMYFEYPIYYDVESEEQVGGTNPSGKTYTALSQSQLETVCTTFMTKLENAGYYPAMYVMKSLYTKFSASFKAKYDFWGAHVKNGEGTPQSQLKYEDPYEYDYSNDWGMWQYSWFGHKQFDGYKYDSQYQQLDVNICYKDYPALMAKYGYNNCKPSAPATNGSLVAGKTPIITGSTSYKGSGLTDGIYSTDLYDGTWLGLNDSNRIGSGEFKDYVHLTYDLGAKYTLTDAKIHLGVIGTDGIGRPYDVRLLVSDDNTNWTTASNFSLQSGTWADGTYTYSVTGINAAGKYVRLIAINSGFFFINEIVVNGNPYTAPVTPPAPSTNGSLVAGKTPVITGTTSYSGSGLTDGIYSTDLYDGTWLGLKDTNRIGSGDFKDYVHLTYDLGAKYTLTDAQIHVGVMGSDGIGRPYDVQLQVSDDNATWTTAATFALQAGTWADGAYTYSATGLDAAGKYVRLIAINSGFFFINEIVVNGRTYTETPVEGNPSLSGNASFTVPNASNAKYNAILNDGKAAGYKDLFTDGAWYGFEKGKNTDAEGYAEIIIDLGAKYDISCVRLHLANSAAAGICHPYDVSLWVSDTADGHYTEYSKNFGVLETTEDAAASNPNNTTAYWSDMKDITGISGRYLKISFYVGGSWMFINEVDVYGTKVEEELVYILGDVDNDGKVSADDYILLKRVFFGMAKVENLENNATAELRCDVNKDGKITADDYILLKRVFFGMAKL